MIDADAAGPPRRWESVQERDGYIAELERRGLDAAGMVALAQAELVAIAAEVDACEGLGMTGSEFMALRFGLTPGEARELLGLSRKLAGLPKIAAAFCEGRLSQATVRSMCSVATPALETPCR